MIKSFFLSCLVGVFTLHVPSALAVESVNGRSWYAKERFNPDSG